MFLTISHSLAVYELALACPQMKQLDSANFVENHSTPLYTVQCLQ
jgi:hypothetical protein